MKRGRYVGTRRFHVRGQRTPEVNKVVLIALKYFNALIAINALTLTALVQTFMFDVNSKNITVEKGWKNIYEKTALIQR